MDELVVKDLIDRLIDLSFAEDIGDGDHTTLSCIPADAMGKSRNWKVRKLVYLIPVRQLRVCVSWRRWL